ncbi:single stranded DNA-binding protein [Microcystis phage vB_MaeS-yong1]|nr:single stranded DNA-binding protein [Microcystis phage vB_MaeS-yong1]
MARGINKVILVGNLGADPELRETRSGSVCNLRIATSETWTDKQSGQKQERTEWHQVVFFGRLADVCADYLRKGKQVYVEGQLRTEKWTDQNGIERFTTKIYGNDMQMLGAVGTGASQAREQRAPAAPRSAPPSDPPPGGYPMDDEDDIPFDRGAAPTPTDRRDGSHRYDKARG